MPLTHTCNTHTHTYTTTHNTRYKHGAQDYDSRNDDDYLGEVTIPIATVRPGRPQAQWHTLTGAVEVPGGVRGEVKVGIDMDEVGAPESSLGLAGTASLVASAAELAAGRDGQGRSRGVVGSSPPAARVPARTGAARPKAGAEKARLNGPSPATAAATAAADAFRGAGTRAASNESLGRSARHSTTPSSDYGPGELTITASATNLGARGRRGDVTCTVTLEALSLRAKRSVKAVSHTVRNRARGSTPASPQWAETVKFDIDASAAGQAADLQLVFLVVEETENSVPGTLRTGWRKGEGREGGGSGRDTRMHAQQQTQTQTSHRMF